MGSRQFLIFYTDRKKLSTVSILRVISIDSTDIIIYKKIVTIRV